MKKILLVLIFSTSLYSIKPLLKFNKKIRGYLELGTYIKSRSSIYESGDEIFDPYDYNLKYQKSTFSDLFFLNIINYSFNLTKRLRSYFYVQFEPENDNHVYGYKYKYNKMRVLLSYKLKNYIFSSSFSYVTTRRKRVFNSTTPWKAYQPEDDYTDLYSQSISAYQYNTKMLTLRLKKLNVQRISPSFLVNIYDRYTFFDDAEKYIPDAYKLSRDFYAYFSAKNTFDLNASLAVRFSSKFNTRLNLRFKPYLSSASLNAYKRWYYSAHTTYRFNKNISFHLRYSGNFFKYERENPFVTDIWSVNDEKKDDFNDELIVLGKLRSVYNHSIYIGVGMR